MVAVIAVLVVLAGPKAGYVLLRTKGSPRQTAAAYLGGWQRGNYAAMGEVSVNAPRSGWPGPLRAGGAELGPAQHPLWLAGSPARRLGPRRASPPPPTSPAGTPGPIGPACSWRREPALVGELEPVRHLPRAPGRPAVRAGCRVAGPGAGARGRRHRAELAPHDRRVASIPLLTGNVVGATAAQAKALGAPYQAGDLIGQGGVEEAYQQQLAGRPRHHPHRGAGQQVDATAARLPGGPGTPVKTSIDMHDQLAASAAVRAARDPAGGRGGPPAVHRPGARRHRAARRVRPRAAGRVPARLDLQGGHRLRPQRGLRPASTVQCPAQVNIGGRVFHNFDNEHLGATSLQTAFAVSCNSTFIMLATQRLSGSTLASTAATFGFNSQPNLGIPATLGRFTTPHTPVDLAADAFGQGTDLVNPLSEASMAGAVEDGTWRPPQLVLSPAPKQTAQPQQLSSTVLATLRPMMRAVVTTGTAANVGFQAGVFGKTGTAEFGTSRIRAPTRGSSVTAETWPSRCWSRAVASGPTRRADRERVPAQALIAPRRSALLGGRRGVGSR